MAVDSVFFHCSYFQSHRVASLPLYRHTPTAIPQPFSPSATPPSWLSNKAMGHISGAFRGSLVHPLVSTNLSGKHEPNPCRAFKQVQTTESTCSWGRMTQLQAWRKNPQLQTDKARFGTYACDGTVTNRKLLTVMSAACENETCQMHQQYFCCLGCRIKITFLLFSSMI